LREKDEQFRAFIDDNKERILAGQDCHHSRIFHQKESELFVREFTLAFAVKFTFDQVSHIFNAFAILTHMLELFSEEDVGADQLVPFALIGTVETNPSGLFSTRVFLQEFIQPLLADYSPLEEIMEYSVVQFIGICQQIETFIE
jgi:hypothetical protein